MCFTQGLVNKLILAIQDASDPPYEPLEHFVFDFQYLIDPITTFEDEADRDIRSNLFDFIFSLIG